MLKQLIARTGRTQEAQPTDQGTTRLDRARAAYEEWRITQDIGAIMAALDRLSDRRLALIGLRREDLYDAVNEMMERVRGEKRLAEEVLALLDAAPKRGETPDVPERRAEPTSESLETRAAA